MKTDFLKLHLGKLNFRCHPLELKVNTFDLIMLIKMYLHSSVLIYRYFWRDLNYIDRKHPFPHIFKYQAGFRTWSTAWLFLEKNVIQPRLILFFLYSLSQKQLLFISGLSGCNIAIRRRGSWFQHVSLVPSQSWVFR